MEKEQKQSRYPWHEAPEWANFAATDWTGRRLWFELEPYCFVSAWGAVDGRWAEIFEPCDNFHETLESRPN